MIEALKRYWWVPVLRGICGIIFGVIAFAYPGLALIPFARHNGVGADHLHRRLGAHDRCG